MIKNATDILGGKRLHIERSMDGKWNRAYLLNEDGRVLRTVRHILGDDGHYTISMDEWVPCWDSTPFNSRWPGGRMVGEGRSLTYLEVHKISEEFLLHDQYPKRDLLNLPHPVVDTSWENVVAFRKIDA